MKYVNKIPTTDLELKKQLLDRGWRKIKEPSNLVLAVLYSFPIAIVMLIIECIFLKRLFWQFNKIFSDMKIEFTFRTIDLILWVVVIVSITIIHEFIHAIFIPHFTSDKTVWGIQWFGGFVTTSEMVKRSRFMVISIMPFIIISIFAPIVMHILNIYNGLIAVISILNAVGSSIDILNIILIVAQVPRKASVIMNGHETYYSNMKE